VLRIRAEKKDRSRGGPPLLRRLAEALLSQPKNLKNDVGGVYRLERGLHAQRTVLSGTHRASTSLSPLTLENRGLSIVPPIRKGNCNLPSFKLAPASRAMVLVKKLSLLVISAKPR